MIKPGEKIREERKKKSLSQKKLAEKLNEMFGANAFSQRTLSNYEKECRKITAENFFKIMSFFSEGKDNGRFTS